MRDVSGPEGGWSEGKITGKNEREEKAEIKTGRPREQERWLGREEEDRERDGWRERKKGELSLQAAAKGIGLPGTGKAKAEGRQASRPSFVPGPRTDIEMESFECE